MDNRAYLAISSTLFILVALAHLARIINGWPIQAADWNVPMAVSWVAFVVPLLLGIWGCKLFLTSSRDG